MKKFKQLTPQDVFFVGGETSNIYQHTAGLVLLDSSERPDFGFEAFRRHMEERAGSIPQFRWKLQEVPLGLDLPYWVEDENFSFDNHIRRIALPSPGDREALVEVVSYLYSRHLARSRPLWEAWFIEGLAGGQYAHLHKMHHCMMDGEAAMKLGDILTDFEPDAALRAVDPAIAEARAGQVPTLWRQSLNTMTHLSRLPLKASREIFDVVRPKVWQRMTHWGKPQEKPSVPITTFNADIGSNRGFVFGSLPMADIKAIKNQFNVTVNDVVLALVGSSLRDYLQAQGALPDESLRALIVVSLRTDEDDSFSNKVTSVSVTLATDIADPVQRLRAIAQESDAAKRKAHDGGKDVMQEMLQLLPPLAVNAMMTMAPPDQTVRMSGANLIVSNVRGGAKPVYFAGARQTATYPMSVLTPGSGINITCVGYSGNFDFGVTIEPDLVPNPWLIIDGLNKALEDYLALIGKNARSRKKIAVKSGVTTKKRATARKKVAPKHASHN